jgi:hypothetical protein
MGNMSASDAAPLPRLGEVYFDVRGESRSMRLSWYADTGVAVFSIWQGGTCTGTFRLPITDLPRMIEALQRGPHGDAGAGGGPHGDPRATELHSMPGHQGRTGHGPGQASGQYGPGDHGSGDYRSADYRPGDYRPGDYSRTAQRDGPDRDLGPEPATGHSDQGFPVAGAASPGGYVRTGAHGRHEETQAAYPDDSLPGGPGGYREGRGGRYGDEPATGVYRGDPLSQDRRDGGHRQDRHGGHQDDPPTGGHHDDPSPSAYGDDPLSGGYRDDPQDGGHHDDPPRSAYGDDPLSGGYRDEPRGGPYRADSLPGGYRADLHGGQRDDPLSGGYLDEPRGAGRRADRRGGDYPDDPLTGGYPGERHAGGYPDDPRSGYAEEPMTARYRAEPPTGDYPTGPSDSAIDDPDYPAPAGNAGYSPARPYVAPLPGVTRGTGEGRGHGRRRGDSREESDLSPDSFPYGRLPAEPEARERGR